MVFNGKLNRDQMAVFHHRQPVNQPHIMILLYVLILFSFNEIDGRVAHQLVASPFSSFSYSPGWSWSRAGRDVVVRHCVQAERNWSIIRPPPSPELQLQQQRGRHFESVNLREPCYSQSITSIGRSMPTHYCLSRARETLQLILIIALEAHLIAQVCIATESQSSVLIIIWENSENSK